METNSKAIVEITPSMAHNIMALLNIGLKAGAYNLDQATAVAVVTQTLLQIRAQGTTENSDGKDRNPTA